MQLNFSDIEINILKTISKADFVYYQYPSKRHIHSHKIVVCIIYENNTVVTKHLPVSIVDRFRIEGYILIKNKEANQNHMAALALTEMGKALLFNLEKSSVESSGVP